MTGSKTWNGTEGSMIAGIILVGIGIYFLLWELGYLPGLHHLWPLILIIVGIALIVGHLRAPRPSVGSDRPAGNAPPPEE